MLGEVVAQSTTAVARNQLDVASLASGMYLLKVDYEGSTKTSRVYIK